MDDDEILNYDFRRPGGSAETAFDLQRLLSQSETAPAASGERWHIVNARWWRALRDHADGGSAPGPIDASDIVDADGDLKRTAREGPDYVLVPAAVFEKLAHHFGEEPGARSLLRYSILNNTSEPVVEVFPYRLKLCVHNVSESIVDVQMSRTQLVSALIEHARGNTNIHLPISCAAYASPMAHVRDRKLDLRKSLEEELEDGARVLIVPDDSNADDSMEVSSSSGWRWPLSSSSHTQPGLCGLSNLGNTCFLNSGLQCISHCEPLTTYFLSDVWGKELNRTNPLGQGGDLAEAYAALIKELYSGKISVVAPRELKFAIAKKAPQFSGYQQHDSQEFVSFLLDGLHEDLNRIVDKPYIADIEPKGRPDEVVAAESWEAFKKRNDSVVVDQLMGQLKSTLVCPKCQRPSIKFDPYMMLNLPVPGVREQDVKIILHLDDTRKAYKLNMRMKSSVLISEVKAEMCRRFGHLLQIPDRDHLVIADIYNHRIYKVYMDSDVYEYTVNDNLHAYLCQPGGVHVPLIHRSKKTSSGFQGTLFGSPSIIALPAPASRDAVMQAIQSAVPWRAEWNPAVPFEIKQSATKYGSDTQPVMFDENGLFQFDGAPGHETVLVLEWEDEARLESCTEQDVSEPVQDKESPVSIDKCLRLFSEKEILEKDDAWFCSHCKEHVEASKQMVIWTVPDTLILHLKRFSWGSSRYTRDKIETYVEIPISGLNLAPYISGPQPHSGAIYDLFAISNHFGGLGGGHYTAKVKFGGKWYNFDDSSVRECSEGDVVDSSAYMLFYSRRQ